MGKIDRINDEGFRVYIYSTITSLKGVFQDKNVNIYDSMNIIIFNPSLTIPDEFLLK